MGENHIRQFSKVSGCLIKAICDVDLERARAVAAKYDIANVFSTAAEMMDAVELDALSIVVPDAFHSAVTLEAIGRGMHVLCEKPLATNYEDAARMRDAAEAAGVINMVNFSYRESSALQEAHRIAKAGELGRIVHIEASYLQSWLSSTVWGDWRTSPHWLWRLSSAHGSKGALGDVGVHILDFASFGAAEDIIAVNCRLKTFSNIKGEEQAGYTLDANDSAVITVELAGGGIGTVHTTRWATGHANDLYLRVFGEKGALELRWMENPREIRLCMGQDIEKPEWKSIELPPAPTNYFQFIESIRTGKNASPGFRDGAKIQRVLDACFESDQSGRTVDCREGSPAQMIS